MPGQSPSAVDLPDCRGLDQRVYSKSENNLESIPTLQQSYSKENRSKIGQIRSPNGKDFSHFSSSFQPDAGPGVSVSTPDCFQTCSTPSSPIHDNLRGLQQSESDSALELIAATLRYVLKYIAS